VASDDPTTSPSRPGRRLLIALLVIPLCCCLLSWGAGRLVTWTASQRAAATLRGLAEAGLGVRDADLATPPPADNGADDLGRAFGALEGLPEDVDLMLGSQPELVAKALDDPTDPDVDLLVYPQRPRDPARAPATRGPTWSCGWTFPAASDRAPPPRAAGARSRRTRARECPAALGRWAAGALPFALDGRGAGLRVLSCRSPPSAAPSRPTATPRAS